MRPIHYFLQSNCCIICRDIPKTYLDHLHNEQLVIRATLADVREKVRAAKITRTALVLVGRVLARQDFSDSRLYDPKHVHLLRPKRRLG